MVNCILIRNRRLDVFKKDHELGRTDCFLWTRTDSPSFSAGSDQCKKKSILRAARKKKNNIVSSPEAVGALSEIEKNRTGSRAWDVERTARTTRTPSRCAAVTQRSRTCLRYKCGLNSVQLP